MTLEPTAEREIEPRLPIMIDLAAALDEQIQEVEITQLPESESGDVAHLSTKKWQQYCDDRFRHFAGGR